MSAATVMYRFAIVASEYNSVITDRLIDGAKRALKAQKEVALIRVPGGFEITLAVKQAAASRKYDGKLGNTRFKCSFNGTLRTTASTKLSRIFSNSRRKLRLSAISHVSL